jgi:AAA+ ATPase superfamily predicted ATPase
MIGRTKEIQILKNAVDSQQPEFIAVFGRRRVGKTYLVKEFFNNKFTFSYTGALNCSTKTQLSYFYDSLIEYGLEKCPAPRTWPEALKLLKQVITQSDENRKVVFLDELPWMDAPRSGFISAFEHFWNSWGSAQKDLLLIICGSSTSWITNKVIRNRGGLHNRVTKQIHLEPFSLLECEQYSKSLGLNLNRNKIIEGYMVMGGVPLYWSKLDKAKSLAQNINDIFVAENGELRYEFSDLYASIFNRPEKYFKIIESLSSKKSGMTRAEIISAAKMDSSGKLSEILEDLIQCGFIRKYNHTSRRSKDALYQLVDFYTLFYYNFVKDAHGTDENYWLKLLSTPTYHTWCGLAFERVCLMHTKQIKQALGISGIMANVYSWQVKKTDEHPGVQIDLLIDRADNVVSICEMKYAPNGYTMTTAEAEKINTRLRVFYLYLPTKKGLQFVLITSNGIKNNSQLINIDKELTADNLFSE